MRIGFFPCQLVAVFLGGALCAGSPPAFAAELPEDATACVLELSVWGSVFSCDGSREQPLPFPIPAEGNLRQVSVPATLSANLKAFFEKGYTLRDCTHHVSALTCILVR